MSSVGRRLQIVAGTAASDEETPEIAAGAVESAEESPEIVAGTAESVEAPLENAPVRVEYGAGHTRDVSASSANAARHRMCSPGDAGERSGALRAKVAVVSSVRVATRSQPRAVKSRRRAVKSRWRDTG